MDVKSSVAPFALSLPNLPPRTQDLVGSPRLYGAPSWAGKKTQEKKLDVAEMRMLRWKSGVTKLDRIRNEIIRGTTKVGEISKKVQGSRLKWYLHELRREDEYVGKRVMAMEVPGSRRRGRPKRR